MDKQGDHLGKDHGRMVFRLTCVKCVLLVCGLVGTPIEDVSAQVNIERFRSDEWPLGGAATLSLNFAFRSGNVDIWEVGTSGRVGYGWPQLQTFVLGNGDLGWKNGVQFSNAGLLHWRWIYKLQDRLLPECFAQVNYDKSRRLDFRSLFGGGMRLGVVYSDFLKLWWGTSYMIERERLDLSPGDVHLSRVWHHRWSNYLSVHGRLNERADIGGVVYYQPQINSLSDYRILGDLALNVDISQRISMAISLNVRYDSKPPLLVEKRDIKIQNSIGFKL